MQFIKLSPWVLLFLCAFVRAQAQYAPPANQPGSTAIYKDSAVFVNWAHHVHVERGFLNALDTALGKASAGTDSSAIGAANTNGVVSLGDGGIAILSFQHPIKNGVGPDFAVFENSFSATFLELAFVEVSSNGIDYVRFPAFSNTDTAQQLDAFGSLDATHIHNLAGKYQANYGTPFDLDELTTAAKLDVNNIRFVKIVDVIGSINPLVATRDSRGYIVNDPFPTPFASSGFDLDAVGVIHQQTPNGIAETTAAPAFAVYPTVLKTGELINIQPILNPSAHNLTVRAFALDGRFMQEFPASHSNAIQTYNWEKGMYLIQLLRENTIIQTTKIILLD